MNITNIKQNRFLVIARTGEQVFHLDDLARIWGINNRRSLVIAVNRYVKSGLLIRVYRGLYAIKKVSELNPVTLGAKLWRGYSYLSAETVLAKYGVIFQQVEPFTFIGPKTKQLTIGPYRYHCRQLQDKHLYNDLGVIKGQVVVAEASLERAAADLLYFNPRYHFDNPGALNKARLRKIRREVYNQ